MSENNMAVEKKSTFNGKDIIIKELTVAQVRKIIKNLEEVHDGLVIEEITESSLPAIAITEATGLSTEELEQAPPSVLALLIKEVEEANPFFVKMVRKRIELMEKLKDGLAKFSDPSKKMSVTS
jgi:hypothetical protein